MSPQERSAYISARALSDERERALAMPALTGDILFDAAAASDRAAEVENLWMELDQLARTARAELPRWPSPGDVAEVRRLEADASQAWEARQLARQRATELNDKFSGRSPRQAEYDMDRMMARGEAVRHELHERGRRDTSDRRER
jgi:hypothetical protein